MNENPPVPTRRSASQIVDAVAEGARTLFLDRSPSAVSMREIAAAADVNLGLIHRYVGSKDDVVHLVLDRHTATTRAALAAEPDHTALLETIATTVVHRPATGRLIAGLILDGADITAMKAEFPLLDHLTAEHDAVSAAFTAALALGWEVFGPALLDAADAGPDPHELVARLTDALRAIGDTGGDPAA